MRHACTSLLCLLLMASAPRLLAQAGQLVPTSTGRQDPKVLSLREMAIDVGISRGYARVNVRQVFENHTGSIQEGTYRFALPPSAAVGDFAIWDGLQRIPGVILEKKRARAIYRELTTQRIDPGLLQQGEEEDGDGEGPADGRPSGGSLFSVTVSPIPPLATKRLELQYQQEVPFIGALGEFRLVLKPPTGEPPMAGVLRVTVHLGDGTFEAVPGGLPLKATPEGASLVAQKVALDRDLVFRIRPRNAQPLRLSAFRNPGGGLPDGVALAPWERPDEIPPEKDGFFLLEALPPTGKVPVQAKASAPGVQDRKGVEVVILFDTSLSHRWGGLESAYGNLVRALGSLGQKDRFALMPFDRTPGQAQLAVPTPEAVEAQLQALRARPLSPGHELGAALAAARKLVGDEGRILLMDSGASRLSSKAMKAAAGPLPLFVVLGGEEVRESYKAASTELLVPTTTELERELFFRRLLAPPPSQNPQAQEPAKDAQPFTVSGGEPRLRHVYPVMVTPLEPGSLSGWVGRYESPVANLTWRLPNPLFKGGEASLAAGLPEKATEARDLPRRWARARVDDLLARIELEGERREWVEEIIELSRRYKFVTPYTAFLAAPRSLLRPRRIQPGDPVLRVECDPGTVRATALFPFGLRLPLVRRPGTSTWEGRFLVPEGFQDGRHAVRILLKDAGGATVTETKHFIIDGKAPVIRPEVPQVVKPGQPFKVQVRTDQDVVLLTARLGEGAPVPLRWDPAAKCSVGLVRALPGSSGTQDLFLEAVDAAKNRGFARTTVEVRP